MLLDWNAIVQYTCVPKFINIFLFDCDMIPMCYGYRGLKVNRNKERISSDVTYHKASCTFTCVYVGVTLIQIVIYIQMYCPCYKFSTCLVHILGCPCQVFP